MPNLFAYRLAESLVREQFGEACEVTQETVVVQLSALCVLATVLAHGGSLPAIITTTNPTVPDKCFLTAACP